MPYPTKLSPPDATGWGRAPVMSLLVAILLAGGLAAAGRNRAGDQKTRQQPASAKATKHWKLYRSEKYGFQLRYPASWKVIEDKDYVGFRDPAWDNPSWPLGGSSITVQVWRNVTKKQALANANIETQAEARRWGDKPVGGYGNAKYIIPLGAAGPPMRLKQTTLAGLPALFANVATRLYHGNANESSGYAGAGDGKMVFLMGAHAYAQLYATIYYKAFDAMVASFRFTR